MLCICLLFFGYREDTSPFYLINPAPVGYKGQPMNSKENKPSVRSRAPPNHFLKFKVFKTINSI